MMESVIRLIRRYILQIGSWIYRHSLFQIKKIIVQLQTNSVFVQGSYFRNVNFEGRNYLGKNTYVSNSDIGYGTILHNNVFVSETKIGRYSGLSPDCKVVIGEHPVKEKFVSPHSAFYSTNDYMGYTFRKSQASFKEQKEIENSKYQIIIGNNVWIATGVRIFAGVTIGDGAIIGACSLVTKDVEPYGIYVGTPAKKVGTRFDPEIVDELVKIKWWEKDETWIRDHVEDFDDVEVFINKYTEA